MTDVDRIMKLAYAYADRYHDYCKRACAATAHDMDVSRNALRTAIEQALSARPLEKLEHNEQYRMQMAGISTAATGYWKEGDSIHPDYDTVALRDVAKLYAKYDELHKQALSAWVPEGWRPIATAPRDGQNILLRFGSDGVSQGKYVPGLPHPWQFIDTNNGISWLINRAVDAPGGPSHWMPIPDAAPQPPAQEATQPEGLMASQPLESNLNALARNPQTAIDTFGAEWAGRTAASALAVLTAPQPPAQETRVPVASKGSLRDMMIDALLNAAPQPPAQEVQVPHKLRQALDAAADMLSKDDESEKTMCVVRARDLRALYEFASTAPQPPAQREWVGLTDGQREEINSEYQGVAALLMCEAKLREKNGGEK